MKNCQGLTHDSGNQPTKAKNQTVNLENRLRKLPIPSYISITTVCVFAILLPLVVPKRVRAIPSSASYELTVGESIKLPLYSLTTQLEELVVPSETEMLHPQTSNELEKVYQVPINEVLDRNRSYPHLIAQDSSQSSEVDLNAVQDIQNQLQTVQKTTQFGNIYEGSPSLSIANPVGFGADDLTGFVSATYQERTRADDGDDGALGFGVGLGDARKAVGVELSYTLASFGSTRDFGTGGFNLKVHRELAEDLAVAVGWNGFINIGDESNDDFKDSVYGVVTKILRTRDDLNLPLSRVAITAGLGNGQFRNEDDFLDDNNTFNVFGSVAVRIVQPVSAIVEWTGQDLALGVSIVPFRDFNLVITPALRDVAGAGDGVRFTLGVGFSFKF